MFEVPQPGEIFTGEDGTVSTVLPDTCDPDYEPEQDELEDYAEFIGIDIHKEPELLYIAREGLRTPLPPEWRACETSDKEIYYFNFKSGESLWDHPLDDVFKEKVVKARAAGTKGGGKEGGKKATSTTAPAPTATKAASPASGPRKASGSTKAVADALFGGKKPSASASLGPLGKPLTDTLLGRPLPDVSDLLSGNMSGSPVLNSSSLNSSTIKFGSPTLGKRSGAASPPQPMMGAKDIEGAMRKRIEEEFAPLRRSTSTRMEKQLQEERDRLEKELAATQAKLKSEYDAEKTSKSAQQRVVLAKEEKDLQAAWEKRLKELQEHLEVLTKKVDVRGKEVESVKGTTIGELKQSLTAKKADDVNAKRAELEAKMQQELTQLEEEQRCALDELQKRGDAFVADSTSRIKADNDKKLAMQSELGEKMVATLQATVTQKQAELDDVIKKVQQAVASLGAPAAGQSSSGATLSRDALIREAVVNAQREADSETEAVGSTCAAKLTQAKAEGKLKLDRLREELEAEKARTAQASSANTSIMTELNVELSPEDQQRLKVEEDTLQKDLAKALENFTNQTDMMVRGKQKAFTATPSPANDERASEAASAKHYAALRELEKEHEDAVTKLKSEHQRRLTTKSIVDPRKVPTFAKLLGEKKRAWLLEHPAPSQELPKLEPIPKWTPPVMGMQSAAVELPPPEEQKRIVEPHVQAARALIQEERESALQALEKEHKAALETFRSSYHTQKKDLLDAALAKRREILLAKSSPATPSTNAAASSTAAISTVEAAISAQKKQHDATVADVKKKLESIDRQTREAEEELESNRAILAERRASAAATKAASPVANPPVVEEVIQEELIADYETYIDEDAARCEEAAVHDKWRAFIARLQSSVADRDRVSRSMTSATSTAITTEKPPAFPLRNSANNSNLGRSAIPPPQDSSVHTLLPGSDGPSLSLVTPIAHRSRGEEHQRRLESDFGSSSLWSTPRGPTVTMRGETSAGSPLLTPYSQVHVPASSLTGEPRVLSEHFIVEQDDGVPLQQEGSWSAARLHQEDLRQQAEQNRSVEDCGQRLAAVRIMLQDRRQELQSRVIQMESLRQEWRTDMHECRRRHNRSEEQLLRKVKSELESDARQLNRLIEQYKEASRQLRHEERQFSDLQDSIKYRGAALVAPSGATPNQLNEGQVSDGVAHALFRVVERLDFLLEVQRKQLKRQRQQDQLRVVRSERHTSRHHSAPISSRKARQVWVEENLDDATPSPRKRHNHARRQSSRRHSDSKGGIAQPMPWSGERSSPSITAQGAIQSAGVAARHAGRRWPSPGPDERDVSPKETGEGASSRAGRRGYPHRQKHIEHWLSEQA